MFPRFGTDGVRGVANIDLTPDVALALGRAAAEVLGGDRVVIGRDTRQSGPMLEAALVAGYNAAGVDVELLGVVPTPTVAWAAMHTNVAGAMISASHNPFADNGIKLFGIGGQKLTDEIESRVQARFHELMSNPHQPGPTGADIGRVIASAGTAGWVDSVVDSVAPDALAGLRLVVDCAHGSAYQLGPEILTAAGAEVIVIGAQPDGTNINDGVGSTHPQALQAAVVEAGADAGLAFDGDADRLIAVDGQGNLVDGDHIMAIMAVDWNEQGRLADSTVVVTVMSNLGFRLAMEAQGITIVETGVGDRYVLEALNAGQFSLGGEQSGHVICRDLAATGDGVLAAVQLLDATVRSGRSLADLAAGAMTSVPQVLKNVRFAQPIPTIIDDLADAVAAADAELGSQGRVLVRPSGTEPLVRIMVEHVDAATADRICDQLVAETERLISQI